MTIIGEEVKLTVTIGEQLKRVPHELTDQEKADKERRGYSWTRRYDYIRTGMTFFRIKDGYPVKKFLETERKPLIDHVPGLIAFVQRQEVEARERREAAERWARERAEQEERARILAARRKAYDVWEKALSTGFEEWDRFERLRRYINALEAGTSSVEAGEFVRWARGHMEALDPLRNFQLPTTEVPDLSHDERARHGEYREPPRSYGYGW
ncbi:hypothetical protein D8M36_02655 [Dermabacter sp. HSID17554]|nr:hypothetical protein D8M36_02655 [Dermabacter sp. HSID17554]